MILFVGLFNALYLITSAILQYSRFDRVNFAIKESLSRLKEKMK